MSRRRFFVEQFADGKAVLAGESARHLRQVLRGEPGELYELSDGREVYLARLEKLGRDAARFALVELLGSPAAEAAALEPTLLVAVVKFDRFEWALEKATELGAAAIVPLAAERSGKALLAAAPKRAARWRKILQEAAQQARRLRPPLLAELAPPAAAFRATAGLGVLLSERPGAAPLRDVLEAGATALAHASATAEAANAEAVAVSEPGGARWQLALAVGPEGGWTDAEFAAAEDAGLREAALGGHILRTETAVAAGLAAVQLYFHGRRPSSAAAAARI